MILKFESLHLENFMSFEEADILFEDSGYTIVSGINDNPTDNSSSNGSGKSSLWEALCWGLTGETIRGCKNICNAYTGKNGALVEVIFSLDEHRYRLIRSKDHPKFKTNLQIFIDDEERSGKGIRESEVILSNLLPDLTPDLLGSIILLGQGLPGKLSSRTPAGRKELLEKLTHSDFMIEDIKNKLSSRKQELNDRLNKANWELNSAQQQLELNTKTLSELKIKTADIDIEDCKQRLHVLDLDKEDIEKTQSNLKECLVNLETEVVDCNNHLVGISQEKSGIVLNIENKYRSRYLDITNRQAQINAQVSLIEKQIYNIQTSPDICPTCGQRVERQTELLPELTFELNQYKTQLESISEELAQLETTKEADKETSLNHLKIHEEKLKEQRTSLASKIEETRKALRDAENRLYEIIKDQAKINSDIQIYEENIKQKTEKIQQLEQSLIDANDKILYYNSDITDCQSRIDCISKMITLANRDFRGYLLSDIIGYMEEIMQQYSVKIFGHADVHFRLEGNSLDILYTDRYYESLSGGEQRKIDLILQFALRNMLSQLFNFSSNILVLDEIFDALDTPSCQRIIDFISSELLDVDSVYIITHHTDLQIPYDHELVVVKNKDNISRIR